MRLVPHRTLEDDGLIAGISSYTIGCVDPVEPRDNGIRRGMINGQPASIERVASLPPELIPVTDDLDLCEDVENLIARHLIDRSDQEAIWLLAKGKPHRDIAAILGWSAGTATERINKAIGILAVGVALDRETTPRVDRALDSLHADDRTVWDLFVACATFRAIGEVRGVDCWQRLPRMIDLISERFRQAGCGLYLKAVLDKRRVHLWGGRGNRSRIAPDAGAEQSCFG